jgi:hypothetical protein
LRKGADNGLHRQEGSRKSMLDQNQITTTALKSPNETPAEIDAQLRYSIATIKY